LGLFAIYSLRVSRPFVLTKKKFISVCVGVAAKSVKAKLVKEELDRAEAVVIYYITESEKL
jgi:hypothetical protein